MTATDEAAQTLVSVLAIAGIMFIGVLVGAYLTNAVLACAEYFDGKGAS